MNNNDILESRVGQSWLEGRRWGLEDSKLTRAGEAAERGASI